jgi:hypothetical protein
MHVEPPNFQCISYWKRIAVQKDISISGMKKSTHKLPPGLANRIR